MYKRADTLGAGESSAEITFTSLIQFSHYSDRAPKLVVRSESKSEIQAVHVWFAARLCSILTSLQLAVILCMHQNLKTWSSGANCDGRGSNGVCCTDGSPGWTSLPRFPDMSPLQNAPTVQVSYTGREWAIHKQAWSGTSCFRNHCADFFLAQAGRPIRRASISASATSNPMLGSVASSELALD